jgi:hypothetical protein
LKTRTFSFPTSRISSFSSFSSMAYTSRLPSSQENVAEQNPSIAANPIHPDPASPPQSDSIDALFNMEAADVVVDSPALERKKRGREGDGATVDTPLAQRRRSA